MLEGYASSVRKRWEKKARNILPKEEPTLEHVNEKHEEHLIRLQLTNRAKQQLRRKDPKTLEKEKKEQGFSLYLNGANEEIARRRNVESRRHRHRSRERSPKPKADGRSKSQTSPPKPKPKTAGSHRQRLANSSPDYSRSRTAPEKGRRKNWAAGSIDIQTARGEKVKIRPPGNLTGRYDDDFEENNSSGGESSEDSDTDNSYSYSSSDASDVSEGEDKNSEMASVRVRSKPNSDVDKRRSNKASRGGKEDDNLMLMTRKDAKLLRQSLEMNASFRESIAQQSDSDSDFDAASTIDEEDEDEEDSFEDFSGKAKVSQADVVVLEFGKPNPKVTRTQHQLSAARHEDPLALGEIKSERSAKPSTPRTPGTPNTHKGSPRELLMKASTPASRKASRPLSAGRKSAVSSMDSTMDARAVMEAMRAENDNIQKQKQQKHRSESAPNTHSAPKKVSPDPSSIHRSSSASDGWKEKLKATPTNKPSTPTTHTSSSKKSPPSASSKATSKQYSPPSLSTNIDDIVSKVLQLDAKGQRKLLKALAQIEDIDDDTEEKQPTKPSRATKQISDMHRDSRSSPKEATQELDIEIHTNWGHEKRVGLTEIQVFDASKKRVEVEVSKVHVSGAHNQSEDVEVLFNNKCKTVKERHMWSCELGDSPVVLHIRLPKQIEISRLKLWNYNRSLKDLYMGVRQVLILLDGDVVFDGELEKGCGNQVFDYSHNIQLMDLDVPSEPASVASAVSAMDNVSLFPSAEYTHRSEAAQGDIQTTRKSITAWDNQNQNQSNDASSKALQESDKRYNGDVKESAARSAGSEEVSENNNNKKPTLPGVTVPKMRDSISLKSGQSTAAPTPLSLSNKSSASSVPGTPTHRNAIEHRDSRGRQSLTKVTSDESDGEPKRRDPTKSHRHKRERRSSKMAAKLGHSSSEEPPSESTSHEDAMHGRRSVPMTTPQVSMQISSDEDDTSMMQRILKAKDVCERPPSVCAKPQWLADETDLPESHKMSMDKKPSWLSSMDEPEPIRSPDSGTRPGSRVDSLAPTGRNSRNGSQTRHSMPSNTQLECLEDDTDILENWSKIEKEKETLPSMLDDIDEKPGPSAVSKDSGSGRRPGSASKRPGSGRERPGSGSGRKSKSSAIPPMKPSLIPSAKSNPVKPIIGKPTALPKLDPKCEAVKEALKDGKTPMEQIALARQEWRQHEQSRLEESWSSLKMFNRSQKGRISVDLTSEAIDEYLSHKLKLAPDDAISEEFLLDATGNPSLHNTEDKAEPGTVRELCVIPELPKGTELMIDIFSTWGDRHYVGMNGIEVFTDTGEQVTVTAIRAEPEDINVLPEYHKDPRVVSNLIDGTNRTRDDTHMWLAPFVMGQHHRVFLMFNKEVTIAMMRVWNYNKSRIHSTRGAKDVEIYLDKNLIFRGEINRACGGISGCSDAFGETILFTIDEEILEKVSKNDTCFVTDMLELDGVDFEEEAIERPQTADKGQTEARPFTAAVRGTAIHSPHKPEHKLHTTKESDSNLIVGKCLRINMTETWGDLFYMGLTGLEVVSKDGTGIHVNMSMLHADPRDLHVMPGYEKDDRTLDKLINGNNITTSDENMWLIPFTDGEDHVLKITFPRPTTMAGLRIWNYNKSPEDTYRGVKIMNVELDGKQVSPGNGFVIRKAPGNCNFDFCQEVSFWEPGLKLENITSAKKSSKPSQSLILDEQMQEYECIDKPCGFIYQIDLLNTWGDHYYIGLNGLEFYDTDGKIIPLTNNHISAHPESINDLPGVKEDIRTPDKLIDGKNDTASCTMWLAPILPGIINRVYVVFDHPQEVSMIKIWNYSKTPNRGVRDFALLVDDLLVYNGTLDIQTAGANNSRQHVDKLDIHYKYHAILFTDDPAIRSREQHAAIRKKPNEPNDVKLHNNVPLGSIGSGITAVGMPDPALRPQTSHNPGIRKGRAGPLD